PHRRIRPSLRPAPRRPSHRLGTRPSRRAQRPHQRPPGPPRRHSPAQNPASSPPPPHRRRSSRRRRVNLLRTYSRCACLQIGLAITSFATAAYSTHETPPILAAIGLPTTVIAWILSARGKFLLPRWAVNTLLTFTLLFA